MNQPLITHVTTRGIRDWLYARENISMRVNDALRLPCSARGEQNLQRRVMRKFGYRTGFLRGKRSQPILKAELRPLTLERQQRLRIADNERRPHIRRHSRSKLRRSIRIQRNRDHPTQHAAIERGNPLRAVLCPQHHAVAQPNASRSQQRCKTRCQPRNLFVACNPAPNADITNDRRLAAVTSKIVKQAGEMGAHKLKGTPPSGYRRSRSLLWRNHHLLLLN